MKSRVFNRTGRVRIQHADWPVMLAEDGVTITLAAPDPASRWVQAMQHAPEAAHVHMDILGTMLQERKTVGTLKEVLASSSAWKFALPDPLRNGKPFSVEIVIADGRTRGLIIARSEPRRFTGGSAGSGHSSSDLMVATADLGHRVWEIRIDNTGPTILINEHISNWNMIARSDNFRMVVIGEVLERIYREFAFNADEFDWMNRFFAADPVIKSEDPPQRSDFDGDHEFREAAENWARDMARRRCERLGGPASEPISAVGRFLTDLQTRETNHA